MIALDTEFIREKTFWPELALIQIASDREAWLVDPLAFNREELKAFLESLNRPELTKIFHSAFGDQECLFTSCGVTLTPSFDTAEGAALLGMGDSIGLFELIRVVLKIKIPKALTRTYWLKRPLNQEMKEYALADVQYLVEIARQLMALSYLGDGEK